MVVYKNVGEKIFMVKMSEKKISKVKKSGVK